jgi:hypothetical protein
VKNGGARRAEAEKVATTVGGGAEHGIAPGAGERGGGSAQHRVMKGRTIGAEGDHRGVPGGDIVREGGDKARPEIADGLGREGADRWKMCCEPDT